MKGVEMFSGYDKHGPEYRPPPGPPWTPRRHLLIGVVFLVAVIAGASLMSLWSNDQ